MQMTMAAASECVESAREMAEQFNHRQQIAGQDVSQTDLEVAALLRKYGDRNPQANQATIVPFVGIVSPGT